MGISGLTALLIATNEVECLAEKEKNEDEKFAGTIYMYDKTPSGSKRPRLLISTEQVYDSKESAISAMEEVVVEIKKKYEDDPAKIFKRDAKKGGEMKKRKLVYSYFEQLHSIFRHGAVEDGDLISKTDRTDLWNAGYVRRIEGGFNVCSEKGIRMALRTRYLFALWTWFRQTKWRIQERTRGRQIEKCERR